MTNILYRFLDECAAVSLLSLSLSLPYSAALRCSVQERVARKMMFPTVSYTNVAVATSDKYATRVFNTKNATALQWVGYVRTDDQLRQH